MVRSAEAQASLRSLRMLGCDPRVSNHEARSVAAHPSRRRAPRGPQDEADQQRAAIVSNNEINNGTSAQRLIFQRVGAICSRQ
jgi:hypothetical protein